MRLRVRHAHRAGFEVTRPAETADDTPTSATLTDCLVAALGVEGRDASDVSGTATTAADLLSDRAGDLGTTRVLLVPDSALVADDVADAVTERVTTAVADALAATTPDAFEVHRAPLGPFVALTLETRAHPYADTTHEVRADRRPAPDVTDWLVATADGTLTAADGTLTATDETLTDADGTALPDALSRYLTAVTGEDDGETDLNPLARLATAGLADPDSAAPDGQSRWLPPGTVVRETITAMVTGRFTAAGATPVTTPLVADPGDRGVGESAVTAPPHDTSTRGNDRMLVRPTPEVGLRAAIRDALGAGTTLPVRVFETPGRSVAVDGSGGTRPTMLTATEPGDAALAAVEQSVRMAVEACDALGVADGLVCRLSADAPVDPEWVASLAAALDRPILVGRDGADAPDRAVELSVVAAAGLDAPLPLGRVRLDTAGIAGSEGGDGADGNDGNSGPWLVTTEPVGSVEAATAAVLAGRAATAERRPLPVALAPTQVRLVPLEPDREGRAVDIAATLRAAGIRADVDDRERSVAAKLDAAADVPFVTVVGDRETDGVPLKVADSATSTERELSVTALRERVETAVDDWPRPPSRVPVRLSERVRFGGAVAGGTAESGDGDSER